jgi:hypothetical protein
MLVAALLFLAAPAQTVQHVFDVDRGSSLIDWEITTSAGTVEESPDKFRMDGTVNLLLDAASGPFASGRLDGTLLFTVPATLYGEIPNPIPFLPPLATFDLVDLQATITSGAFSINPATGAFTATAVLQTTAGVTTLGGLFGSGTSPAFGIVSPPTPVTATITQSGSTLTLFLDLDVNVTQVLSGVTVTIVLDGPIYATADVADAHAPVVAAPVPLTVGALATVTAANLNPGAPSFLAGSIAGLGSTAVGQLGVTLNLASPAKVGATVVANGSGAASWSFVVPPLLGGRSVWFQALQNGLTTQVAGSYAL